jgi:hypothetical protein
MLRAAVCSLLVPSLLLSQLLGIAHGGACEAEHHQRPHFHIYGGHEHHESDPSDLEEHQNPDQPDPLDDHDNDAVYLSTDLAIAKRHDSGHHTDLCALLALSVPAMVIGDPGEKHSFHHPPVLARQPCPIYLRTLALLI